MSSPQSTKIHFLDNRYAGTIKRETVELKRLREVTLTRSPEGNSRKDVDGCIVAISPSTIENMVVRVDVYRYTYITVTTK
jgi:hypothetical protein